MKPFAEILDEHGVPEYLKIDIEGNDRLCVDALAGRTLPKYISVEAECVSDTKTLLDSEALAMIDSLCRVGYKRFKLVNQVNLLPVRSEAGQLAMRVVTSLARGRLRLPGTSKIAEKFADYAKLSALNYSFSVGSTGPWGEDVPGSWMSYEAAEKIYLDERRKNFSQSGKPLYSFWNDWHATY